MEVREEKGGEGNFIRVRGNRKRGGGGGGGGEKGGKTSLGFTNSGSKLIERIKEYFTAERNVLADKIVH